MKTLSEVKAILKANGKDISRLKAKRKETPFGYVPGLSDLQYQTRHLHVAYCMSLGTPMFMIEDKDTTRKPLNQRFVDTLIDDIKPAIRACDLPIDWKNLYKDVEYRTLKHPNLWSCFERSCDEI